METVEQNINRSWQNRRIQNGRCKNRKTESTGNNGEVGVGYQGTF